MKHYYSATDGLHFGVVVWNDDDYSLISLNDYVPLPTLWNVKNPQQIFREMLPLYTVTKISEDKAKVLMLQSDNAYEETGRQNELSDKG